MIFTNENAIDATLHLRPAENNYGQDIANEAKETNAIEHDTWHDKFEEYTHLGGIGGHD